MGELPTIDAAGLLSRAAAAVREPIAAAALHRLRHDLTMPLRVALVGRVSAGKSTILNALLAHPIAATSAGECTRIVTAYRQGLVDRATIVHTDGSREPLMLVDGRLPADLPAGTRIVEQLDVELLNDALGDSVVVDTPGLESLAGWDAATTRELERADGIVFVIDVTGARARDTTLLSSFQAAASSGLLRSNVVVLLNKADLLVEAGDDVAEIEARAAKILDRWVRPAFEPYAGQIVPVVGLFAEAARAGTLRQEHVGALAQIAASDRLEDAPIELRRAIGDVGIAAIVAALRADPAVDVRRWLLACSGLAAVQGALDQAFRRTRGRTKIAVALGRARQIVAGQRVATAIRAELGVALDSLGLRLEPFAAAERGRLLGEDAAAEVAALAGDAPLAERLRLEPGVSARDADAYVAERAAAWRRRANGALTSARQEALVGAVLHTYAAIRVQLALPR